jgi:flagellar biosynthesis protein FlhG
VAGETPRIVAVASGKGGTGKSLLAANVGIFLATLGKKVVVVDGALGGCNTHIFSGVARPSRTLSEALGPAAAPMGELAVPTPVPGLRLIGGTADPDTMANLTAADAALLVTGLRGLRVDWIVVDLGPGTHAATLELFLAADIGVLCAVPDPTSIELMHRFLRAAFLARLRQRGLGALAELPPEELREREGGMPSALELYLDAVELPATAPPEPPYDGAAGSAVRTKRAAGGIDELRRAILGFRPQLVINAARSKSDMELGRAVASVARRRLGVPMQYLGHLEYDEAVWASTRRRRPLLVEHPETRIAKCFERVARGLLGVRPSEAGDVLPSDSHYELLEVPPTASFEDIRRANRRIRDIYGAESVAISGLYDPASLEAVHRRLDLAYTTLMDAAKRKEYDLELFPEGVPLPLATPEGAGALPRAATRDDSPAHGVRPPMPDIGPRTVFSGAVLRSVREALGIELREIAERSKIGMAYLQAIEDDRFAKLPAAVYVRGFLGEYARLLGLEPERVKDTYLERYKAARPGTDEDDESGGRRRRPTET